MSAAKRKWTKIDLMKFISRHTYKEWNKYLDNCVENNNITSLVNTYYGLQIGYQYAQFQKLNDRFVFDTFVRLQTSTFKAMKRIYKKKFLKDCPDPLVTTEVREIANRKTQHDFIFEKYFPGVFL